MTNDQETFLVTGAAGCIGAWAIRLLLDEGVSVVATDLSDDLKRLELISEGRDNSKLEFATLDVTQTEDVATIIAERSITNLGLTGEISEERRIITFSIDDIRKPGAIEALDDLLKLSQYRTHINMGDGAQQSAAGEQIATLLLVLRVGTIGWQGEQRAR